MKKNYVIDTSVLLDDANSIVILRNGEENEIYIPYTVILELNHLKKDKKYLDQVLKVIDILERNQYIHFLPAFKYFKEAGDLQIIDEVTNSKVTDPIIVTNDRLFRILCKSHKISCEPYFCSQPFQSESQLYTGFSEESVEYKYPNTFVWINGKPHFYRNSFDSKIIDYENKPWGITPTGVYQNLALELLLNDGINLVSIQSKAGYGKSYLALACAMQKVIQDKKYDKIYLIKPTIEIGDPLGFLPGTMDEKVDPYIKYLKMLIYKLYKSRGSKCGRLFIDEPIKMKLNPDFFEILPLAYIRGMNIENSFVIVDEAQNLNRTEVRSLLTRMGENTKCCVLGDVMQIDNRFLSQWNNGLNWIVKMCLGENNYGHIVLKGERSRGPICDIVLRTGL